MQSRKGIGGRKPTVIENPFWIEEETGRYNLLDDWSTEENISLDDLIKGCIESFSVDRPVNCKPFVHQRRLFDVYRDLETITRQNVQEYLECSESQAKRYIRVIKTSNIFIKMWLKNRERQPTGYRE